MPRYPAPLLAPLPSALAALLAALLAAPLAAAESPAIRFDGVYTADLISNLSGGVQTGGTYLDNLDLQLSADRGAIFGIPGLSGLLYGLRNNDNEFSSEYVGDNHVVSNIDAGHAFRLFEAWLDWSPDEDGDRSVRLGLYDLGSEFDATESGALFINSAQGTGTELSQTGRNGPSLFPVSSLALRVRTGWGNGGYGQFAVLDGVPGDPDDPSSNRIDLSDDDGALVIAEVGWSGGDWRKVALGAWTYTADFEPLTDPDGPEDDGNEGWYAFADRTVFSDEAVTVAAYLRVGQAEEKYNPFSGYVGFGTTVAGLVPGRREDELGFAVAIGLAGDDFEAARAADGLETDSHETTLELTWRAPVTDWLVLQPDVQYMINPGNDPALDDAVVVALRFELSYSRLLWGGR